MAMIKWIVGNGNWSTASKWDANAVPGPGDDAVIDAAGNYTITINGPIDVGSIAVSNTSSTWTVNAPGQTDAVGGALSDAGALLIDSGGGQGGSTLSIGGTLSSSNFIQIGNGNLSAATT